MLPDREEQTDEPTAEFRPGHALRVRTDRAGTRYFVEDEDGALVALLPDLNSAAMVTKSGRWQVGVERQAHGWKVVARTDPGSHPVGFAYPRWWPDSYKLEVGGRSTYTLRMSWLTGAWRLRQRGATIARLSPGPIRSRERGGRYSVTSGMYPASIELARDRTGVQQLPLLIGLALGAIKCESEMGMPLVGGGGY